MRQAYIKELFEIIPELMKSMHQRSFAVMDKLNLYPGQPQLLARIKEMEGVTQKELACKHFVKPATITGMLMKLEEKHLVYREPDKEDKRIMRVYLTEEGKELADRSKKIMNELTIRLFDGFTEEELHQYITLTKKIIKNVQE
ncbi:MAG: MarR family transcriptional regulator [Herbinix sp.]|jgi:DNA-binding MarR family transcriptional regulator|nr:MarR family transcriptional regulator [Herbinix sp.]